MKSEIYHTDRSTGRIMAKEATEPQNKHADGIILPSSSQKHSQTYIFEYAGVEKINSVFITFCHSQG